ncbi:MAG TPA: glycerophosphodiester phosphodiesterase, partial [Candidatus Saccharimonadales bacterium]|nr:glycerophosphodiester phosphodiesterase [Candidatus Saccharimonadales bacterium]
MKIIGHRGARGLAPENTIAALRKGLEHHADMLEFDLRVTKDGVVILHHDAAVSNPSGEKLAIANNNYKKLRQHQPDLATFENVLNEIGRAVPLYVEVKPGEPVGPIIKIVQSCLKKNWKNDDFLLASKSQQTLRELHRALPQVPNIVIEPWSGVRAHRRARQINAKIVAMNQRWLW